MKAAYSNKLGIAFLWFMACTSLFFLMASNLASLLPSNTYWMVAIAGLLFPAAFIVNVIGLLIIGFIKHRLAWLFFVMLLISIPNITKTIAFNTKKMNGNEMAGDFITVMSWNVGIMNFSAPDSLTAIKENKNIFQEIKNSDADVVCLQEFFTALYPGSHYNLLDSITRTMKYPYHYFSKDLQYFSSEFYSGSVIFSRFPIVDTNRVSFTDGSNGAIIKVTIKKGGERIDLITSRLQSVYLNGYDYATLGMERKEKKIWKGVPSIVRKLKYGFQHRARQVELLDSMVKNSRNALITCVDLNDTPTGNAYQTLNKKMMDVWRKCGSGLGRTFKLFSPTLRIDYIFCTDFFEPINIQRVKSSGSDHLALIAQLRIKKGVE